MGVALPSQVLTAKEYSQRGGPAHPFCQIQLKFIGYLLLIAIVLQLDETT